MFVELHPRNPCRPPDWRWRMATLLREEGLPPRPAPRRADPWVRRAMRHMDRLDAPRPRRRADLVPVQEAIASTSRPTHAPR